MADPRPDPERTSEARLPREPYEPRERVPDPAVSRFAALPTSPRQVPITCLQQWIDLCA